MFKDRFWIIGHEVDFDYIIFGQNTGPYSKFPEKFSSDAVEGRFCYLYNFISQIRENRNLIRSFGPPLPKCFYLDKLNKNVREPERCFDSEMEIKDYLCYFASSFILRESIHRDSKRILEDFFTVGLLPN